MLSMPTYMENNGVLCTKIVCFYNREEGSSSPSVEASVVLLDPEHGTMKAVSKTNAHTHKIYKIVLFGFKYK